MGRAEDFFTRAAAPRAGLGNLIQGPNARGGSTKKGPKTATLNVSWQSPGQPQILDQDAQQFGEDAYLGQVYVMRCCQAIAQTISGLPFRAGMDPTDPANHDPTAPLVQLLGEATPQAPGGPNPKTAARAFWAWSIIQYLVYGRWAWEAELAGKQNGGLVVGLWPLVSPLVSPIPTQGGEEYFESFVYTTPQWGDVKMAGGQVVYAWRPSLKDWRLPETVLSAAKLPIYIGMGLDRYMVKLLQNDMVASTLVVTPPFDEPSARRAWQEQFLTSFSGVDNRGKTIFAEAEYDEDDTSGKPLVQVEKIAQTAVDAQLLELSKTAKDEICVAFGVPLSLIGNAQERIYANASSEYKNFWTMTVMNLITEIQDHVNTLLAPRLGEEVGWFDLSRVAALQPPQIFAPPMIGDVINYGIASAAQIANVLGIPAADAVESADTDTVELGEESAGVGPSGINRANQKYMNARAAWYPSWNDKIQTRAVAKEDRLAREWRGTRVTRAQMMEARIRYEQRPINSYNWEEPFRASKWLRRDTIHLHSTSPSAAPVEEIRHDEDVVEGPRVVKSQEAESILSDVEHIKERARARELERRAQAARELIDETVGMSEGIRMMAVAERVKKQVKSRLQQHYPDSTLGWVDEADWDGPKQVNLEDIDFGRRPGGRDAKKTSSIMKAMVTNSSPAVLAPVVLVDDGSGQLKVADGYHRTLARKKLGHVAINAYVGRTDSEEGPWTKEMHDQKLNREAELAELRRTVVGDNQFLHLGKSDQLAGKEKLTKSAFLALHPGADADDYPFYEAGYYEDENNEEVTAGPVQERAQETAAAHSTKVNKSVYYEGVSDERGGRPKKTSAEFEHAHPDADDDDFDYYEQGFEDAKKPGFRNAWLPNQDIEILHCAECGQPATSYSDGDSGPTGYCSTHVDVHSGGDDVRAIEIEGVPLKEWLHANELGLMALAEEEMAHEEEPPAA